jgi:hypothetical protein
MIEQDADSSAVLRQSEANLKKLNAGAPVQGLQYEFVSEDEALAVNPVKIRLNVFGEKPVTWDSGATLVALAIGKNEDQQPARDAACRRYFGTGFDELAESLRAQGAEAAGVCQITCRSLPTVESFVRAIVRLVSRSRRPESE